MILKKFHPVLWQSLVVLFAISVVWCISYPSHPSMTLLHSLVTSVLMGLGFFWIITWTSHYQSQSNSSLKHESLYLPVYSILGYIWRCMGLFLICTWLSSFFILPIIYFAGFDVDNANNVFTMGILSMFGIFLVTPLVTRLFFYRKPKTQA